MFLHLCVVSHICVVLEIVAHQGDDYTFYMQPSKKPEHFVKFSKIQRNGKSWNMLQSSNILKSSIWWHFQRLITKAHSYSHTAFSYIISIMADNAGSLSRQELSDIYSVRALTYGFGYWRNHINFC